MECKMDDKGKQNCPQTKDVGLLVLRLVVGFFMLTHGWAKLSHFGEMSQNFPPMLGLSSSVALSMIIFAEFFCSIALILGLFTRLATIPLIIGMSVAAFIAHAGQPFNARELPLLYLGVYLVILLAGPGKIAIDNILYKRICPHGRQKVN